MRYLGLPKRNRVSLTQEIAFALIAVIVLLAGATGAPAQTVTRGVPDAGSSDGLGRPSEATTSDVTPAFANTPTPALGNPTPALGNPTPAPSNTPTSPLGSPATATSTDGTISGDVSGTMSTDDTTSVVVSTDGSDTVVTTDDVAAQPSQSGATARRADARATASEPIGRTDATSMETGTAVMSTGDRASGDETGPTFVIVTGSPTSNTPTTRPMQFTMICNGGGQAGCKSPPRFVAVEN